MTTDAKKDFWDKLQISTVAIAAVAVPVALGLVGNAFNSATKEKDVRLKTVEIAIGVLSQDPNKSTPFLRDWAIDVVDSYSGIPFSEKARDELRRNALPSKDAERLLGIMSDPNLFNGASGGVFFESSVANLKVFLNDADITPSIPHISSRSPIVGPVGSVKIRVEFDGGKFETLVPVMQNHLTKVVVAPTGLFAEKPAPIQSFFK